MRMFENSLPQSQENAAQMHVFFLHTLIS